MKQSILTFVLGVVIGGAAVAGFFMTPRILAPEQPGAPSALPQSSIPSGRATIVVPVDDPNQILGDSKVYSTGFRMSVEKDKDGRTRINLIH